MSDYTLLAQFASPSEPGGERAVVARVLAAVDELHLSRDAADRLGTAVSETVMNAIEHGNHNNPTLPVEVTVRADDRTIEVMVSDRGGLRELPDHPEVPDLDAKLAGLQRPRGWGLFLVRSMVDDMDVVADPHDPDRHTARLRLTYADPPTPVTAEGHRHAEHV